MLDLDFEELDRYLLNQNGRIIHQVWFGTIPNRFTASKEYKKLKKYRESWIMKNPMWFRFEWNVKMSESLVKTFYPEHYEMYRFFPYQIQRCDMVRYCFLHRYGGLYADMDYFCNKPFDIVLEKYKNNFYLVQTPNMPGEYVSNSLMYSVPKHIFWRTLLIAMQSNRDPPIYYSRHLVIMYSAGPGIVNRVYHQYKNRYKLESFPHKFFQPFGQSDDILSLKNSEAYTIHASKGCWHSNDSSIIVIISRNWVIFLFIILIMVGVNYGYYLFSTKETKNNK
jgi:mannosyltransferase OCH1-like enzyme